MAFNHWIKSQDVTGGNVEQLQSIYDQSGWDGVASRIISDNSKLPMVRAQMSMILNDHQKAIDYLEVMASQKMGILLLNGPFWKPLNGEPRYQALLKKIGLPMPK